MNILAIESASTVCGTALFLEDKMVAMDEIMKPRVHGEHLPVIIDNILTNNSLIVADLDGIAVSSGPGSYTGLRIGMSLAKGLAVSEGIPIISVPTLQVMNREISREGVYWVLLHSHKNVVFAQKFHSGKPDSEIECEVFNSKKYCKLTVLRICGRLDITELYFLTDSKKMSSKKSWKLFKTCEISSLRIGIYFENRPPKNQVSNFENRFRHENVDRFWKTFFYSDLESSGKTISGV